MFETTVVKRHMDHRRSKVWSLPLTITLYISAVATIAIAMIWSVELPAQPPQQNNILVLDGEIPLPSPPPEGTPAESEPIERDEPREEPPEESPEQLVVETPVAEESTTPEIVPISIPDPGELVTLRRSSSQRTGEGIGSFGHGDPAGVGTGDPDRIHDPGRDVTFPRIVRQVLPEYPPMGIRMRREGSVVISCVVGKDGAPRNLTVVRSSHSMFEESALEALSQYRFSPGRLNGEPVNTRFNLTIHFSLSR